LPIGWRYSAGWLTSSQDSDFMKQRIHLARGFKRFAVATWTITLAVSSIHAQGPQLSISPAVKISWQSVAGKTYQLLSSSDLQAWSPIGELLEGTGEQIAACVETSVGNQMFFQVEETNGAVLCPVASTRIASDDVERVVQYSPRSESFHFVGEQKHWLFRYNFNGDDFWWCTMNDVRGSGLLEYLMTENPNELSMRTNIAAACAPGFNTNSYAMLRLSPLISQKTWVINPGGGGYKQIPTTNLVHFLYLEKGDGNIYLATCHQGIVAANDGIIPLDVYVDVAFKAVIPLTLQQKTNLCAQFSEVYLHDGSQPFP
jgi:hypothetical protein